MRVKGRAEPRNGDEEAGVESTLSLLDVKNHTARPRRYSSRQSLKQTLNARDRDGEKENIHVLT